MGGIATREFVDLEVEEVSLVDSAANEQVFAIIKSLTHQEDGKMAKEKETVVNKEEAAPNDAANTEETTTQKAESVPVEVNKAEDASVQKAMDKVLELVEGIAKSAAKPEEAALQSPRAVFKAHLEKAGLEVKAVEKALGEFDAAQPVEEPVEKNASEPEPVAENTTAILDSIVEGIQKAKTFTPTRQAELTKAVETLTKLLGDLTPQPVSPASGSGIADVTKVADAPGKGEASVQKAVDSKLSEVLELCKSLVGRVEKIEKTRQPTSSLENEGTDTKIKTKKSLWDNVL